MRSLIELKGIFTLIANVASLRDAILPAVLLERGRRKKKTGGREDEARNGGNASLRHDYQSHFLLFRRRAVVDVYLPPMKSAISCSATSIVKFTTTQSHHAFVHLNQIQ